MGATPTGATPTGPTLDPLNILVNKFNIATHVALILFLFSSWINYLLYDTKSVMVFWQLLSKIKRFVTIFRISWNGPTLFNIPIGDFPPVALWVIVQSEWSVQRLWVGQKSIGLDYWTDSSGSLIKCWSRFLLTRTKVDLTLTWQFRPSWATNFFRVTHLLHLTSGLTAVQWRQKRVINVT